MAKENVKIFSENVDTATKSIKSLRQELKELKDAMTNVDEGSEEFYKLADKAGAIQHQITEITETVRGASADFGIMLSNSMQAFNGIVGGLQAVQGAMQFFGYESESLVKTMSQLQGLMAVGQGISQIDSAIKAIDRLRVAITGTTKTAKLLRSVLQPKVFLGITAAISALLFIWNKWGDSIKKAIPIIGTISDAITNMGKDSANAADAIELNKKRLEEFGRTAKEVSGDIDGILKKNNLSTQQYKNAADNAKLVFESQVQQAGLSVDKFYTYLNNYKSAVADGDVLSANIWKGYVNSVLNFTNKAGVSIATYYEDWLKYDTLYQESLKADEDAAHKAITEMNKRTEEAYQIGLNYLEEVANRPVEVPVEFIPDDEEDTFESVQEWVKNAFEGKRLQLDLSFAQGKLPETDYWEGLLSIENAYLSTIKEGTNEWYQQALVIENIKKKLEETKQATTAETASTQDWLQVASVGLGSLGNLFSGLADLQDTTTKAGIEQQAKFQYMAALMNTANAILGAWNGAMTFGPASFVMAGIQTAAAAAMGAIQIAQIKKAAEQAGANLSGSSASVSSSGISSITAPVQYTQDVNAAYIGKQISDSKMYVSVTEIDRVSNRVNVAESESKY